MHVVFCLALFWIDKLLSLQIWKYLNYDFGQLERCTGIGKILNSTFSGFSKQSGSYTWPTWLALNALCKHWMVQYDFSCWKDHVRKHLSSCATVIKRFWSWFWVNKCAKINCSYWALGVSDLDLYKFLSDSSVWDSCEPCLMLSFAYTVATTLFQCLAQHWCRVV